MPLLDVSDVLSDPDLVTTFGVIRRSTVVNTHGETTVTAVTLADQIGYVGPAPATQLSRLSDEDRSETVIMVVSKFLLRATGKSAGVAYKPDMVVWRGEQYMVVQVSDWEEFGAGFTSALARAASLEELVPGGTEED